MGNQPGKLQTHTQSGRPKKNVHWKSAERPSPPGRPILIALSEQQPDVVNLHWERSKLDGGSPITGYVVEHRRMGSPHWVRATPTPILQCEVSISGLEPGWRYQFRVFAENIVGRSDASELSDALTVTLQRNAITVPRFVDELQETQAVEDERIEFRVRILGEPPPEINWFKDGYEIFSSRRTKIVNDNDVSVLIIHQVALTDQGEIKCTATNRAGHVVTKAQLLVQAPPRIRLPRTYEDGLIVEADEVLRLKVGIAGQPAPVVSWLHEGETIPSSGRFELTHTDKNSLLKIDNVQREDRGEYTIRAWNRLGEDVTSFLVTVTARPNAPGRVRLNMSFGKSATLSWTAPIDDGGCKIGNYIVEYFRIGWNVWLKAATTRSLSTTLHDLIEGSEYKFRVKAENPYGLSDPSEESEVLFIPDPKRGITKPKSASKLASNDENNDNKPLPPRRKTLSPSRPHADASTETMPRISPSVTRKPKPQLIDNEELHREMSYGTSDQALKGDVRKSPSQSSADSAAVQNRKEKSKLTLKIDMTSNTVATTTTSNHTSNTTNTTSTKTFVATTPTPTPTSPKRSPQRSPTFPMKLFMQQTTANGNPTPTKNKSPMRHKTNPEPLPQPPLATPEHSTTPEGVSSSLERKHSLTPPRKPTPLRKSPTPPEPIKFTAALQRSTEPVQLGVNQHVRRFSGHSLSPAKHAPSLAIAIATSNIGGNPTPSGNGAAEKQNASTLTNPTIQISAPPTPVVETPTDTHDMPSNPKPVFVAETPPITTSDSTPPISGPRKPVDKHDDVHTSNEFMLVVFDKNSRVKDNDKPDSFELDLEDAIQAPPISISAPDLAFLEFTNLHTTFPLRRSVSSTELLYERAMARFYEAVELEQAEKERKVKISQDKIATPSNAQPPATFRKRLGSMTEAERLSFERRSELRRQSADVIQDLKRAPQKWSSRENISGMKPLSRTTGMLLQSQPSQTDDEPEEGVSESASDYMSGYRTRSEPYKQESYDLGSDYTESTASSEEDSIEKFKKELMERTRSPSPRDLETYHPRNMTAGVFTPYRAPTPEQAAVVLTRPMPLPSPDFVPKPILKRSSNESVEQSNPNTIVGTGNTSNGNIIAAAAPIETPSTTSNKLDIAKGIKSFFQRDKRSPTERNTEENEKISNPLEKTNAAAIAADLEAKRKIKEEEELKRQEAEKLMLEEAHAAVDHYSDLVRQVSNTHRYHTPIYLDREELKKAAARAAAEGNSPTMADDDNMAAELRRRRSHNSDDDLLLAPPSINNKPRLSISERGQMVHVRDTASDLAVLVGGNQEKPNVMETPPDSPKTTAKQDEDLEELQFEVPQYPVVPIPAAITKTTETVVSETVEARPDARGRTRLVKVKRVIKRRVPSSTRSRDASTNRPPSSLAPMLLPTAKRPGNETPVRSSQTELTLLAARNELLEQQQLAIEQSEEAAHEKVRSALSYCTDMVLFMVACYVYLFKDARLVLPILALIVYRQLGEAISAHIPNWMKRKRS